MSEINRCGCGGEGCTDYEAIDGNYFLGEVVCRECGISMKEEGTSKPGAIKKAIAAWNTAMRPRPRVRGCFTLYNGKWDWAFYICGVCVESAVIPELYDTEAEALAALREFCEKHGFELEIQP